MPQPLVNRTLMAWFRRHFAARRTLGWHSQLGHKLKGIYPGRKYGGAWATTIMTELEKGGIVGLTRDLLYKSQALANALTPEQVAGYGQRGLTWSHMRLVLVVASSKDDVAEAESKPTRRKTLQDLLDRAIEQSWSVRRLQREVLASMPSDRPKRRQKSKGWDADISLLTRITTDWNKHVAIWTTIAETARRRVRARRSASAKAAIVGIDMMLKSAKKVRDAMAAD